MKTCKTCGIEKELTDYATGRAVCKPCFAKQQKKRDRKEAVKSVEWDEEYHRKVCTSKKFIDEVEKRDIMTGTADRMAYILAAIIERLTWDEEVGAYCACVPWTGLDQLFDPKTIEREVEKLEYIGALAAVKGKYSVVICKKKNNGKYKRKIATPKNYHLNALGSEDNDRLYEELGESDSEAYEADFPGAHLVQYWTIPGHEACVDWHHYDLPYWTIKSEACLSEIVCNTTQPERWTDENATAYVDPLFHGIDWWKVMAVAQNDVHRISVGDDVFEFDDDGYIVDLSDMLKDQVQLGNVALLNLQDEARREDCEQTYEELCEEAQLSLWRGQLNAATRVYEGRVLVRQRSNTRIHNRVSAMKDVLREYLYNVDTGAFLKPKDVNNAGIASAVYKVSHLADTCPDVAQFIQDAKDGTFYEKAYNWLAENGVKFENPYDEGGKAEVKYGTRAGRTDYENVCSGVLPHLYHSGNTAYEWLAEQGCEVDNSKRRNRMHDWAYANYPNVYAVIDEAKRAVAEEWLVEEISQKKFRDRYRRYSAMKDALDCGSTVEEVAEDWFLTAPFKRWNDEGDMVDTGYSMYLKMVTKVHDGLAEGKTLFQIAMPSALQIRDDKITSRVSRSIHDCETAGQWQGVLAHKEVYPESVVVSIHDCIMTDTDADHLGECLVWGWANCLHDEDTGEFYGVDVSVDDDEH